MSGRIEKRSDSRVDWTQTGERADRLLQFIFAILERFWAIFHRKWMLKRKKKQHIAYDFISEGTTKINFIANPFIVVLED